MKGTESPSAASNGTTAITRSIVVARKECTHAVRSSTLRLLIAVLLLVTVVAFRGAGGSGAAPSPLLAVDVLALLLQVIVPIAAILVGCLTLAGERESGSLRFLFGLAPSRTEVVFGKFLGTIGVLAATLGVTFVFAVPLSYFMFGAVAIGALAGLALTTMLLAGAFVGFAIGVSAIAASRKQSIAAAVSGYMLVTFLWEPVVAGAHYAVTGTLPDGALPAWLLFLERLNPLEAYAAAAGAIGVENVHPLRITFGLLGGGTGRSIPDGSGTTAPIYLADGVAICILIGWMLVPTLIGLVWFRRVDLA
ncbi:hypothetical protein D8Y22_18760 [Salinadaptatus halalkaliphilus]|uniref:ABC transporter permease n=1 Tax=Salinadaptatus halalkaliphilus TaxID=2419781 RepID=A0A4S3THH2_9EURY|nr:ABC transporter permease subunit [Salinadaptatus halalkaliphilus]THE63342.1 hypothetical protein D8Y22_18760 [Salinadaptatus halalkaliphilus]